MCECMWEHTVMCGDMSICVAMCIFISWCRDKCSVCRYMYGYVWMHTAICENMIYTLNVCEHMCLNLNICQDMWIYVYVYRYVTLCAEMWICMEACHAWICTKTCG